MRKCRIGSQTCWSWRSGQDPIHGFGSGRDDDAQIMVVMMRVRRQQKDAAQSFDQPVEMLHWSADEDLNVVFFITLEALPHVGSEVAITVEEALQHHPRLMKLHAVSLE